MMYTKLIFKNAKRSLPVKLMYWGNVLFPAVTLLWAIAVSFLHRKIGFSPYLCGLLAGAVLTAIPIFFIAELEKAYFLGFDAPTLNQYLLFGVADILFIISAVMYLSNAALLYWKESKPDSFRASVLKGMMHFVELYHGEFSEERLLRALRNIHPVDIYRIGQDDPARLRGWKKYVFPIYTAYNGKCRKDALPMKF